MRGFLVGRFAGSDGEAAYENIVGLAATPKNWDEPVFAVNKWAELTALEPDLGDVTWTERSVVDAEDVAQEIRRWTLGADMKDYCSSVGDYICPEGLSVGMLNGAWWLHMWVDQNAPIDEQLTWFSDFIDSFGYKDLLAIYEEDDRLLLGIIDISVDLWMRWNPYPGNVSPIPSETVVRVEAISGVAKGDGLYAYPTACHVYSRSDREVVLSGVEEFAKRRSLKGFCCGGSYSVSSWGAVAERFEQSEGDTFTEIRIPTKPVQPLPPYGEVLDNTYYVAKLAGSKRVASVVKKADTIEVVVSQEGFSAKEASLIKGLKGYRFVPNKEC